MLSEEQGPLRRRHLLSCDSHDLCPGNRGKGVACCPPGTVAVPGGTGKCCQKGDLDCCEPKAVEGDAGDELSQLTPKLKRGQLCVKGKVRSK